MMLLALIHAELGSMHAVSGGLARFPHHAFGSLVGFGAGWMYWVGSVTTAPIEVEAAIQYGDKWINQWFGFHIVHQASGQVVLTGAGYAFATVLMFLFTLLNLWGARRLSEANTSIVTWKIAVPVVAIIALIVTQFHSSNFSAGDGFAPAGTKGILSAIATGGVIFSYQGFEQAIQFGGETRNPKRSIPLAVLGSMVIGAIIYALLQVAFLGALNPHSADHGWAHLTFANQFGPFAAIAGGLGLSWLAYILYVDAFVSPAGTGLIYTGASARLTYAMGRNGYIPKAFSRLSARGIPWISVIFSFAVGMIVFLPFPGWQKLVSFITSSSVAIYAVQCLSLVALRRQMPDRERPFRLWAAGALAPVGFVIANLIILFAGWDTNWKLLCAVGIGLVLFAVAQVTRPSAERVPLDWRSSLWLWPWLAGLGAISYVASFEGGTNALHFGVDTAVTAVFAIAIYVFALRVRLSPEDARERLEVTDDAEPEGTG
jgi:amino acid transporter